MTDFLRNMIIQRGGRSPNECGSFRVGKILKDEGCPTTVGDEGGYAPHANGNMAVISRHRAGWLVQAWTLVFGRCGERALQGRQI